MDLDEDSDQWVISPIHQKLNGTESQRTPKEVATAIRFSGLGVRSVGPVGDFLEPTYKSYKWDI